METSRERSAEGRLLDDRYEVGRRLGEGGMGVVYRAHDTVLERTVAVKVFRDGATEVDRTGSETRLLASLNHPSLVTLFDAHVAGGDPRYLVMEFVDGPTLHARLQHGPLSAASAGHLARDIAGALHVVHEAGIVHRDIKPANVLLRPSSVPGEEFHAKLADFGIAHLVDSARLTTPGTVIGSAAYLSPEQVTGSDPSAASDIYALGLVLLEALTGRRAFGQIAAHESAVARLTQDPVIPSSVGHAWGSLLQAMTARDPLGRPTALELVVRARSLDAPDPLASVTATVADAPMTRARQDQEPSGEATTLVAPAHNPPAPRSPTQPTVVAPLEPTSESSAPTPARRRRMVAWVAAASVIAVLVVGAIAGNAIWSSAGTSSTPPALPALEEPLASHLQQLLGSVSP
ncbi:MAG: protein kinase [Microbacterium sp.]